ncbi:hypothetical protein [Dyella sp. Tek66A03]|uniref:hypothetical protein n=1 Tax=Dyella sp. Tek66A03 TaxID=3458298 RepID=UPI00403EE19C
MAQTNHTQSAREFEPIDDKRLNPLGRIHWMSVKIASFSRFRRSTFKAAAWRLTLSDIKTSIA